MNIGDEVPDLELVAAPGRVVRLSELCPGRGVLIFLRHLA
jgi:hypothetical protein